MDRAVKITEETYRLLNEIQAVNKKSFKERSFKGIMERALNNLWQVTVGNRLRKPSKR